MIPSFLSNLSWRYATKKFDPDRNVSGTDLEKILQAIRLAPSSYGQQPFHVTVISDRNKLAELKRYAFNQPQFDGASHLLVFSARTDLFQRAKEWTQLQKSAGTNDAYLSRSRKLLWLNGFLKLFTGNRKGWAAEQTYVALGFALAAAAELNIDSCPMEGFRPGPFKRMLDLSRSYKPVVLLALGYRNADDHIHSKVRFSEEDLFTKG
jgi:nitroreductase